MEIENTKRGDSVIASFLSWHRIFYLLLCICGIIVICYLFLWRYGVMGSSEVVKHGTAVISEKYYSQNVETGEFTWVIVVECEHRVVVIDVPSMMYDKLNIGDVLNIHCIMRYRRTFFKGLKYESHYVSRIEQMGR